jgi:hypothetical protein
MGVTETFNAVLDDMQSVQEIGAISQNTKIQLENPSFSV